MKALRDDDWITANSAMDSLITSAYFDAAKLLETYNEPGISEEVQWRIVYVFGHRHEPESIPLLTEALQNEIWLVHTEAAVGLCRFDPVYVIPEMKKLGNNSEKHIRNNSRWVIKQINH
ncbi:MAG TPA: HEAT repeat domain-containing protein [Bacteroidetes bacterium]|nr:HEAT repeat domain-containing protein [Bacteroidota bacterium]